MESPSHMTIPTVQAQRPRRRSRSGAGPTIAYLAGPIDADHVRDCWLAGRHDETYHGTRYLTQFYDVCAAHGYRPHVVAPTGHRRRSHHDDIEYWQVPFEGRGALLYHLGQVLHLSRFALRAVRLGVDAVVVVPSPPYWFLFLALRAVGIPVIPSLHRVLWPRFRRPRPVPALLLRLTRSFLLRGCGPILVVSEDIGDQVVELTAGAKRRDDLLEFRPTYTPERGDHAMPPVTHPSDGGGPLRILFVGRVEADKGVFLLLDAVERLVAEDRDVAVDVCGTGSALPAVRRAVAERGLTDTVRCHGYCDRPTLAARYAACHVVVVPTTTAFVEGFNKVVAEAVLAGRPVVTSAVCPALRTVEDAAVVVPPDEPGPYAEAIRRLHDDAELYRSKQAACGRLSRQFLDPTRSWGSRFEEALRRVELVASR